MSMGDFGPILPLGSRAGKPEQPPKTTIELVNDALGAARAIIAHCKTAPYKTRWAYSVDVSLIEALTEAMEAMNDA